MITQNYIKENFTYCPESGLMARINCKKFKITPKNKTASGYVRFKIFGKNRLAHRLIWLYMTGEFPSDGLEVDHINGIRDDNRWANLRLATRRQNRLNSTIDKDNKSGYKGVCWSKHSKKWRAACKINYQYHHIGLYENKEDAHKAYVNYVKELHGEFYTSH